MYKWIDGIIDDLSNKYSTNDIYELLDIFEIEVIVVEANNILLKGNDSLYIRNYMGLEVVFIRNDIDINLEKFILRHEFAHAILHKDICSAAFNKIFINKDKYEKQANYFALKIANSEFDEIQLEGMSIEQIASCIEVPFELLYQFNCI
ncbi:ImmA/IrrE family metallo-endopeptidase [Clostridium sulfidigenes]|uniref:ImmA/IrrE family metallo-endopeptidase n=1 Tax=Clostridium sulfidigenes TaxID=318464 RepID=UPI003F8A6660